jgi:hypothetical protein
VDHSTEAYYVITGVQRVDKVGGKVGWASTMIVDICDGCWQTYSLLDLEALVQGGGVKQNAVPQLNEKNKD